MTLLRERPWWLGLAVILMGSVCIYASTELAATAQYAAIGPGMFVIGVGVGLIGLGVLLLIQIAQGEVFEPEDTENAAAGQPMDKRAFFTALVAAILPALVIDMLGLPLTGMLSFMLVARAFGSPRLVSDLIIGLVLAGLGWLLFGWLGLDLGGFLPLAGW
ncbi:tripartite tricarboxylate transporter TctB family protein [Pollutimonas harenae]|uniref:Tripartite tricarboxylate transporter TctB family protein n=1 Tax=Pollutimonas harenae TaxID=657015 RepID=A0A853GXS2_9BURK|nr:tripartite tricarboxylate transporter TctB family protein [Pollutimonas harenae]NYT84580.1 tripartite tricarboxylate transporter TctB family protein [Pollutimonas harenae]TEA73028.1 tripartite tricarboxylate transporter TctB family protein [Pollutimonas harenae]